MDELSNRMAKLRETEADRRQADEAAYGAAVAAESRGESWNVAKLAEVLPRLGRSAEAFERDVATAKRAQALEAEVATAKTARDAAHEEQSRLADELKAAESQAATIRQRRHELQFVSSHWVHVKAEADRFYAANEWLLSLIRKGA